MKGILSYLAPALRRVGFKGSGQYYRKTEADFVFVVNFQGSPWGDRFYINLGAQPVFIPAEGQANWKRLKEYQCILRRRVGTSWPWEMSADSIRAVETELLSVQNEFFGLAQTMRASFAVDPPGVLLQKFSSGTTEGRATLHLARAGMVLGQREKAFELARRGLELAGDRAPVLRDEINALLAGREEDPPRSAGNAASLRP